VLQAVSKLRPLATFLSIYTSSQQPNKKGDRKTLALLRVGALRRMSNKIPWNAYRELSLMQM
jgi:hypothetical protein